MMSIINIDIIDHSHMVNIHTSSMVKAHIERDKTLSLFCICNKMISSGKCES